MDAQTANILWLLVCSALVFVMQAGFLCLESGFTRSKNSINVSIKNVCDFGITVVLFWGFGFGLMFGKSAGGLIGGSQFLPQFGTAWSSAFFLFHVMFCGTATTIVSGAVAERMKFAGYLLVACLLSGVIYTVFGHWVWNGAETGQYHGWLYKMGFRDFAGSTVVHGVGGSVALAAILVIGPRRGRFDKGQQARKISGHDLPVAMLGAMLLVLGWFGFNGGSTLKFSADVAGIFVNTLTSAATGLVTALFVSWWVFKRPSVQLVVNGLLAGLVSITGCCQAVGQHSAAVIGVVGAVVMLAATGLLERLRIDDAVGAVPVHGAGGVWGGLAVALFANRELLPSDLGFGAQLAVQILGVAICFLWSFGLGFLLLSSINRIFPLRVSLQDEQLGLNVAEHGAKTELLDLLTVMHDQAASGDTSLRAAVEPFTEVGQIAAQYNQVMQKLQHVEQQRAASERRAITADRAKSDFLAKMSHEFRTPLNSIIGMTELAKDTATASQREYLELVASSSHSLLSLVNDILDFSKVEAGKIELEQVEFNVRDRLRDTLNTLAVQAHHKGLALVRQIASDVPETVVGDPTRLSQVLINLVSNAIKFTAAGKVVVSADVESQDAGGAMLKITVHDTGIGIPAKDQSAVFAAFEQADSSTTRQYGGTGLGLAISKQLVELMGGRIWIESELGQGATIHFTINVRLGLVRPGEEDGAAGLAPLPAYRILVVEDNQANRTVARHILSKWGQTVATANNGREAMRMLADEKFDLALMDVHMPEFDGLETTRAIRESERQTGGGRLPIIAMTAAAMAGDRQRCLNVGMDGYVSKPIERSELHAAIAELMLARSVATTSKRNNLTPVASGQVTGSGADTSFGDARIFDQASFLRRIGDEQLARQMLEALVTDDFPRFFADLQHAVAAGDAPAVERAAHGLKGALGELGATAAQTLASQLELAGREQRGSQLHHDYDRLVGEVQRLSREIEAFLGRTEADQERFRK